MVLTSGYSHVLAKDDAHGMEIEVNSAGVLCATGRAALPSSAPAMPSLADFKDVPARAQRPEANERTLAVGDALISDRSTLVQFHTGVVCAIEVAP